jgi:predicted PurR-regulated permease PerM
MESVNTNTSGFHFKNIVDNLIRLGVLVLLLFWCFDILKPFLLVLIWAVVIAIAIYPLYRVFLKVFRKKKYLAAVVLICLLLSIVIVPSAIIIYSLYDGLDYIRTAFDAGQPLIPSPAGNTDNWPAISQPIIEIWQLASDNLHDAIVKYSDEVKEYGPFLLLALAGIGKGIIYFIVSIIISGFLLVYSDSSIVISKKIFEKLIGTQGDAFADITVVTIQNVVKGILGVAVIQATMAGLGFFIAGVPYAGLWTVLALIFAIIQIGVGPVVLPIIIYMFSVLDSSSAVMLSIWLGITLLMDSILKPILLGRNAPAPMMVIFLGSIGGFIYNGFIGLFLGAIVLTVGYKLFMLWLNDEIVPEANSKISALSENEEVQIPS